MKAKLRKIFSRFHFILLAIVVINIIIENLTVYRLENNLELWIEILTLSSGLVLFIWYFSSKPFKRLGIYFSFYALFALAFLLGFIFRGIIWAIVLFVLLSPIIPDEKRYEKNGIIISEPFQGFMSACCPYELKERKFLIFEKDYGIFEEHGWIDFESLIINETSEEIELFYSTDYQKDITKTIKK